MSADVVACGGVAGYAIAYVAVPLLRLPLLWYGPLDGTWRLAVDAAPPAMSLYGQILWGLAGGLAGAALASFVRDPSPRARSLAVSWAATAWALALAYMVWTSLP